MSRRPVPRDYHRLDPRDCASELWCYLQVLPPKSERTRFSLHGYAFSFLLGVDATHHYKTRRKMLLFFNQSEILLSKYYWFSRQPFSCYLASREYSSFPYLINNSVFAKGYLFSLLLPRHIRRIFSCLKTPHLHDPH